MQLNTAQPTPRFWVERYMAELEGAKRFLAALGFNVSRASEARGTWYVSSYSGEFDNDLLVKLARYRGFEA